MGLVNGVASDAELDALSARAAAPSMSARHGRPAAAD